MTDDKKQTDATEQTSPAPQKEAKPASRLVDPDEEMFGDEPDPVEILLGEIADMQDKYVRLAADMDNLRKRTEREKKDIAKYAISDFARDVLTLGDNFQRAIKAVPADAAAQDEALKSFLEGVKMNERELQKMLERHGVKKLNPHGEKFDPNMHQAVQQIKNDTLPNNTVCDVLQEGYVIADRVLRPAVVCVAKGGPKIVPVDPEMASQGGPSVPVEPPETADDETGTGDVGATLDKNA